MMYYAGVLLEKCVIDAPMAKLCNIMRKDLREK